MALEGRCKTCKLIKEEMLNDKKGESSLERRLYHCRYFDEFGESHYKIAEEYGIQKASILNHLKYHQNPDKNKLVEAKFERNLAKQSDYRQAQDKLISIGMEKIESGETKVPASVIASVARDKMNQEEKQKDRAVQMMELYFAALSGELDGGTPTSSPAYIDAETV